MIADTWRIAAYERALRQAIKPGCVVLDIGAGTGILALLACRLGARRVYAIEPNDAIGLAREIAAANGCTESIEFIQELSTKVALPEQADVIVSDLRGILPLFPGNVPAVADARRRFLAPGGILIPRQDELWAAVVEAPELYQTYVGPWERNGFDFDMRAARRYVTNTWRKGRVGPEQLLVEPRCWATLDYTRVESTDVRAKVTWTVTRAGTAHGLAVWFDTTLTDGVRFSNAPGEPELIYGIAFFPWSEPVILDPGQTVTVALAARQVGQDYVWLWGTEVLAPGDSRRFQAQFKQSDFFGEPRSAAGLRKQAADHVPTLNEDGRIDRFILAQMDGRDSLGQIASRVAVEFPGRFPTWQQALTRVGKIALGHSQ
jgi:protein arginine N-methyltransferase 1